MRAKICRYCSATTLLLAISAMPGMAQVGSTQPLKRPPTPTDGVLLLRNGEVFQGRISLSGDQYHVALPGGEIRIRSSEVELCAANLREAYLRKRTAIQQGDVRDHVRLAGWCERHGLADCAARELTDAKAADATHPMIPLLERRLGFLTQRPPPKDVSSEPVKEAPSAEELDHLVQGMPPASVETFIQTIQPLLVNNCTATGCHGLQSDNGFQLFRIRPGQPPSRRVTQRNLHAALQFINRSDPAASPLLTAATRPHGTVRAAIFTDHHTVQCEQMVDWVHEVSSWEKWPVPGTGENRTASPASATTPARPLPSSTGVKQTALRGFDLPDSGNPVSETANREPPSNDPPADARPDNSFSHVKRGQPLRQFAPIDPFDPAIFNRRFHPQKNPAQDDPARKPPTDNAP